MPLLEVKGLTKHFGGLAAVNDVSFDIEQGQIFGLIGPNGAGKSTFFNLIAGVHAPTSGKVMFKGEDITGLKPHRVAEKGIVRTFQLTTLLGDMTVLDNVLIGCHLGTKIGFWGSLFGTRSTREKEKRDLAKAMGILESLGLAGYKDEPARDLPGGHQRRLGVAIALAADPELLLLDEPVTGMTAEESAHLMALIGGIRERGTTVLLVEHNMRAVMGHCDRIVVLNFGQKIAEGLPKQIQQNRAVIEAYLGAD